MKRCSFCDASRSEVEHMVAGASAAICSACIARAQGVLDVAETLPERTLPVCSFCKNTVARAQYVGLAARICDPCIQLCVEILNENAPRSPLPVARVHRR